MKKIILSIATVAIIFIGCDDNTKEEIKTTANNTIDNVAKVTENATNKAIEVVKRVKEQATPVVKQVKQKTAPVVEQVTAKAKSVEKDIEAKIHAATAPKIDGKTLFKVCSSCHGQHAQKKALNASRVIQGWSKDKIETALHGYQNGTYGGAMKAIMMGQAKRLDDAKISALASYISTL